MQALHTAAMTITVNISVGLRAWIADNLTRGAPPAALIDVLVEKKFEPHVARGLMDAFVAAHAAGTALPEHSVRLDVAPPAYASERPRIESGNLIRAGDRDVRVLQRLDGPIVVTLEQVFTAQECERLIELARPRLTRSTVVDRATGADTAVDYRNSEGMFFRLREDAFITGLDERVSAVMNCPVDNGEGLQVLRYGPGGHTAPHFDFLLPTNTGSAQSLERSGQRISTLIVYLNDVPEGGETVFPEVGLSVMPRRGNGLYFEYANGRMQVDARSVHAGAAVARGEKWIVTKWMRERRFVPRPA